MENNKNKNQKMYGETKNLIFYLHPQLEGKQFCSADIYRSKLVSSVLIVNLSDLIG